MTDLERLFRLLVQQLAGTDPGRLHRPMSIAELSRDVVPYRSSRRMLAVETAEDHDALLLRLAAGEGGFVRLIHDDIRRRFELEAQNPNPDLALLRDFGKAQFLIATEPLARALADGIVLAPTPVPAPPPIVTPIPAPIPPPARPLIRPSAEVPLDEARLSMPELTDLVARHVTPPAPPRPTPPPEIRPERPSGSSARCAHCGGALPTGRVIKFCPHCGQNQAISYCPSCQARVELGWRHCVSCGQAVGG